MATNQEVKYQETDGHYMDSEEVNYFKSLSINQLQDQWQKKGKRIAELEDQAEVIRIMLRQLYDQTNVIGEELETRGINLQDIPEIW